MYFNRNIHMNTHVNKTLLILDASGFVFRAYYGMRQLTDQQWRPVQAVYGFFRLLLKVIQQFRPDYLMLARDSPAQTLRSASDETYKANRISMPKEFWFQMRSIKELIVRCEVPFLEVPWYEADDIIWTIVTAQQQIHKSLQIVVASSDKDLKQLLSPHVQVRDDLKRKLTTFQSFKKHHWYEPVHIVDYLSLVWDAADNIKWVPWIWKKWAQKLVSTYGSLDQIYSSIDEISWSLGSNLRAGKDEAFASKEMIQLMDVPSCKQYDISSCRLDLDFDLLEQVLVEQKGFYWLKKSLKWLQQSLQWWKQLGLFW